MESYFYNFLYSHSLTLKALKSRLVEDAPMAVIYEKTITDKIGTCL